MKLDGKNVVVGVSGGIAAYKVCLVVRGLKKLGANVDVIMTEHATHFVTPLTFETLSQRPVAVDMFAPKSHFEVEHIGLAKKADLFLVCPATANILGKMANGIADDMLSTTVMATSAPVVVCPAMNSGMFHSEAVVGNLEVLKKRGVHVINAGSGFLACGDIGDGRMAEPDEIIDFCEKILVPTNDLSGKKVLVSCGATLEKLDDVRFVSNFSSGKMGAAVIRKALDRGAEVTAVLARHSASIDPRAKTVEVSTTQEMFDAIVPNADKFDITVLAAAPCDYKPKHFYESKIKSDTLSIEFVKNPDIAQAVGQKKKGFLCIFAAETDHGVENAAAKLAKKHADLAVLNDVKHNNVFGSDTNVVTFLTKDGKIESFSEMTKDKVADLILNRALGK